jgi:uncharacterized protein YciI
MFVLMRCLHKPGQDAARDEHRPAHRAWVGTGGNGLVSVLIGSAILTDSGETAGNFGILEAKSLEDARAFAEGDAFNTAGIVEKIELIPLPDTFQAQRITDPMSPRL